MGTAQNLWRNITSWLNQMSQPPPETTKSAVEDATENRLNYQKNDDALDITYTVANKLSKLAMGGSQISIHDGKGGENDRTVYVKEILEDYFSEFTNSVTQTNAFGGIVSKVYTTSTGELSIDTLPQDRIIILKTSGDKITSAIIVAEEVILPNKVTLERQELHVLEGNTLTITQVILEDGKKVPIEKYEQFRDLPEVTLIGNIDNILASMMTSPVDTRKFGKESLYGVPITFGAEKLIAEVNMFNEKLTKEIRLKDSFVGVSDLLFDTSYDENGNVRTKSTPKSGLYQKFKSDNADFFEEFSPTIREQSYINSINFKLSQIEKTIGVSRGLLTESESSNATATEIKRSSYDTMAIVSAIRKRIEVLFDGLLQQILVVSSINNELKGDVVVTFEWSSDLLEDSAEQFTQIQWGYTSGLLHEYEARAFITGESHEEAKENVPTGAELIENEDPTQQTVM